MIPTLSHQVKWRRTPSIATMLTESFPLRGTHAIECRQFRMAIGTDSKRSNQCKGVAVTKDPRLDKILGLHEPISRRDFLDGTLKASTGMLAAGACPFPLGAQANTETNSAWAGYTGEGDYKQSAGNTEQVMQNAHAVRDGKYNQTPADVSETGEVYDCVVVGGGFSGLSAGLFFHKQTSSTRNCLILDNAHIFGGVAKRNEFIVDGHRLFAPQASVHFQPPATVSKQLPEERL